MKYRVLRQYENLITVVIDFFTSKATNPEYFEEIKLYCKEHSLLKRILNHDVFLKLGYLTRDDFLMFATGNKKVENGVPTQILDLILEALTENLILLKMEPNSMNNTHSMFMVNDNLAKFYHNNGLLFNKLFGFNYIIEKYIPSVFKIEHIKNDEVSIGNGFLILFEETLVIITNKHVVENADKIIVKNYQEKLIEIDNIIEDEKNDLAFILTKHKVLDTKPFLLNLDFQILENILTIGYPPIPTTKKSYPLFHLGEVNSFVENFWGNSLFIFSAKTNPGNSGSPIIDKNGSIIGIVTQQLEEQEWYKRSKIPYYAGIPSNEIMRFLNDRKKTINKA